MHSDLTPHSNLLNPEHLLRVAHSMRTNEGQELQRTPHATSRTNVLQLADNLLSLFYPFQGANTQHSRPGLPEILVVLKIAYDRKFPEELTNIPLLATLWRYTTDIAVWSQVI